MVDRQKIRVAVQGLLFFTFVFGMPFWFLTFVEKGNPLMLLNLFYKGTPCFFDPFFHIQSMFVLVGDFFLHINDLNYLAGRYDLASALIAFVSIFGLLGITIVMGRVFCSWICPFGAFLDFIGWVRDFIGIGKQPLPEVLDDRFIKYGLLIGFLISSLLLRREVFCDFCPAGGLFKIVGPFYLGPTWQIIIPLTVLVFVIVLTVRFDTRAWCKYFCPLGAFLAVTSKITPWGRMDLPAHACVECRKCEKACPMDLDIVNDTKYKLINSKEVKKVLQAEGDPAMLQMPKKFDKLPEPVQEVLIKGRPHVKVPAGECIRCFKCLDECPVQTQILKKLKEEKAQMKLEAKGGAEKEEEAKT